MNANQSYLLVIEATVSENPYKYSVPLTDSKSLTQYGSNWELAGC